jgi:GTP cyclohydrolase II
MEKSGKILPRQAQTALISPFHRVERAAGEFRRGAPVLIRRPEGSTSLAAAAETVADATLKQMIGMGKTGFILITHDRAATLKIRLYTEEVIALPIDTSISAESVRAIADPASDLDYPLKGPFHPTRTQPDAPAIAAVRLAKLSGLLPAAVLVPLTAEACGRLMNEHMLASVDAADVLNFQDIAAETLRLVARATVPLKDAEHTEIAAFRSADGGPEHYAILIGDKSSKGLAPPGPVLTRIHSECFTGDLLGSLKCDCGDQLRGAIKTIKESGGGILLYLAQEGRGIGLMNKLRAYRLQDEGYDTLEANTRLGFAEDERLYDIAARMLQILGYHRVRLLTNNPGKISALQGAGIDVTERVPHSFPDNLHNREYLRTKSVKAGHLF